ncbi:MAG TPA: hypothetical protein VEO37_11205 [Thermoanaerobaculia bacterium]|nr:hypothetical protein [Thermoanaerobaculia bacterium]
MEAQAAEITSDDRARTRTPSDFFMTDPPRNRTPDDPWFDEEYTAAAVRIEAAQFLQELFRFARAKSQQRALAKRNTSS